MKARVALLLILIYFGFTGCEMKHYTLKDGITKVPFDSAAYINKSKFNPSLLSIIDTATIYEKYNKEVNLPYRQDKDVTHRIYGVYKFYSNGYLNYFVLDRDSSLSVNDFNPEYNGYRGVYFIENNKVRYNLYAGSNELGHIGKLTGTFVFSNDTLYNYRDANKNFVDVYIKRKLPSDFVTYSAKW